jgi:glc operon protein GlcG
MVQSKRCAGVAEHSSVMGMVLVSSYIRERGARLAQGSRVNAALSDSILAPDRNQLAMMKPGISVGLLATVLCLPVGAQTIKVMTLDQAGAQTVLQAAKESAQQRNAPSAIAVVDPAGDLLAFQRMDGVRPASADLAIQKARTAARLQRPTAEIEDNINHGRTAFVTADIAALRGGMPIRVNGEVVGAVGVAGLNKDTDTGIADTAAAVLGTSAKASQQN